MEESCVLRSQEVVARHPCTMMTHRQMCWAVLCVGLEWHGMGASADQAAVYQRIAGVPRSKEATRRNSRAHSKSDMEYNISQL